MSPQIQSVGSDMNVSDARSGALLEVHELSTVFRTRRGEFAAVDRVSFDVAAGEIVALVGESGSGKSVTALSVMGLLDPRVAMVSGGVMRLEGSDLRSLTADALRRLRGKTMAMIFQEPMTSLNPTLTIGRQLSESLELHDSLTRTEAKHRVRSLLHSVGIADPDRRLNAYPHELSGGMRQRVMVASALSCSPRLLLADEPTTALDVTTQAQILELIEQLAAQSGTAVLLITHDLGLVARHADQVNVMYAGRLVERAPVASLFATPAHPYTRALLAAVPRLDRPRGDTSSAIDGLPPALDERDDGCAFRARCPLASERCAEPQAWVRVASQHVAACWRAA
jgi:oligopeptide/dipeptide ABC transporter ATP-binding protein